MDVIKIFAERLKDLRSDRRISALALSKQLGVGDTTILRWEKGIIVPTIINLYKLAVFFEVTADYLIGLED